MREFDELMVALKESNRPYDFDKITEAYEYAAKAHEGQMRQSGDPYITHPIAVAQILLELGMDTETICAGLLHDVVEDTSSTLDDIKKRFGAETDKAQLLEQGAATGRECAQDAFGDGQGCARHHRKAF